MPNFHCDINDDEAGERWRETLCQPCADQARMGYSLRVEYLGGTHEKCGRCGATAEDEEEDEEE